MRVRADDARLEFKDHNFGTELPSLGHRGHRIQLVLSGAVLHEASNFEQKDEQTAGTGSDLKPEREWLIRVHMIIIGCLTSQRYKGSPRASTFHYCLQVLSHCHTN